MNSPLYSSFYQGCNKQFKALFLIIDSESTHGCSGCLCFARLGLLCEFDRQMPPDSWRNKHSRLGSVSSLTGPVWCTGLNWFIFIQMKPAFVIMRSWQHVLTPNGSTTRINLTCVVLTSSNRTT